MSRPSLLAVVALVLAAGCHKKPPAVAEVPTPAVVAPAPPAPVPPAPSVVPVSFQAVYFDFDRSDVRDDQRAALAADAAVLQAHPELTVEIEGHCDERGTTEYNLALGQRRAVTVERWLEQEGVSASRLRTVSYGEERPADPGHDEAAWARNRRAEMHATNASVAETE